MFLTFKLGILLGLSIITSIGSQNLFLIKQALRRENHLLCALTCFLCDTVLIVFGALGASAILLKFPVLQSALLGLGIVFLLVYGGMAIRRGFDVSSIRERLHTLTTQHAVEVSSIKLIALALSFSLLNPHAILDAMIIIGGNANHYVATAKYVFLAGTIAASLIWFLGLTISTSLFARRLMSVRFWCALEFFSGFTMIAFAASFLWKLIV